MDIGPGTKFGPYTVEREVGFGSTGVVYRAWSARENRTVAVKLLAEDLAHDPGVLEMFDEEAQAGLTISHPHIVKTLLIGRFGDRPYIVFEFIHGVPLQELIRQRKLLAEGECVWILRQIGQALRELRRKNVVHQDMKPDNILLDGKGDCKLTDLGFARRPTGRIDWSGCAVGTAYYMSPEQCSFDKNAVVDHRADLYSFGATLYHAATGTPVFSAPHEEEILEMHRTWPAEPACLRNPRLRQEFSKLLSRLLEKKPEDRFQTAEDLLMAARHLETPADRPTVFFSRVTYGNQA